MGVDVAEVSDFSGGVVDQVGEDPADPHEAEGSGDLVHSVLQFTIKSAQPRYSRGLFYKLNGITEMEKIYGLIFSLNYRQICL